MQEACAIWTLHPIIACKPRRLGAAIASPASPVSNVAILSRLFKKYDWIISQSISPCNALPSLYLIKPDNIRMPT